MCGKAMSPLSRDRGDLCLNTKHSVIACYPYISQIDNCEEQEPPRRPTNSDKSMPIGKVQCHAVDGMPSKGERGSPSAGAAMENFAIVGISPTAVRVFTTSFADGVIQRFHKAHCMPWVREFAARMKRRRQVTQTRRLPRLPSVSGRHRLTALRPRECRRRRGPNRAHSRRCGPARGYRSPPCLPAARAAPSPRNGRGRDRSPA